MTGTRTNDLIFTRGTERYGRITQKLVDDKKLEEKLEKEISAWLKAKKSTNH